MGSVTSPRRSWSLVLAVIAGLALAIGMLAIMQTSPLQPSVVNAAAPEVAVVAGHVRYYVPPQQSTVPRDVTVAAQVNDGQARGTWVRRAINDYRRTITCAVVEGSDAWLAGPVTKGPAGHEAMFLWVHDGGASGDTAFQWIADPGETLEDMEAHCEAKRTTMLLFPGDSAARERDLGAPRGDLWSVPGQGSS